MRKIILNLILSVLLISTVFIPVFAEDNTKSWKEKATEYQAKRAEHASVRLSLNENVSIIRQNKLENQLIWSENSNLRAQVKLALKDLRESDGVIDGALKIQLKSYGDSLKLKYQALNDTTGDIRELTIQIKDLIKAKDTDALNVIYAQIIDIQFVRNGLLSEINVLLSEIIALLKK